MTTFYFDISKLIERVQTNSLLLARNIKSDRNNDFFQLSITDAEDFIQNQFRTICARIFADALAQYARGLDDPYLYDTSYEDNFGQIVFNAEFPSTNFNLKLTPVITQAIEDLIVDYTVAMWLYHSNYDYTKAEEIYEKGIANVIGLTGRRYNLKRNYKLF